MRNKQTGILPTEEQDQRAVTEYLRYLNILHYAIPNGIPSNAITGRRFKEMGLSKGVPDLCIPIPNNQYHGLYVELKAAKGGSVIPEQQAWIDLLNFNGYRAVVCEGFDAAVKEITNYLKNLKDL